MKKRQSLQVESMTGPVTRSRRSNMGDKYSLTLNTSCSSIKPSPRQKGLKRRSGSGIFVIEDIVSSTPSKVLTPSIKKQRTQVIRKSMDEGGDKSSDEDEDQLCAVQMDKLTESDAHKPQATPIAETEDQMRGNGPESGDDESSDGDESVQMEELLTDEAASGVDLPQTTSVRGNEDDMLADDESDDNEISDGDEEQSDAEQTEKLPAGDAVNDDDVPQTTPIPGNDIHESCTENVTIKFAKEDHKVPKHTVFVENVPLHLAKGKLGEHFSSCGSIKKVRIWRVFEPAQGYKAVAAAKKGGSPQIKQRGVAVIEFHEAASANKALELNNSILGIHRLRVSCRKGFDESKAVYVGNLPFRITEKHLWEKFRECGPVEAVKVLRGFGFVNFMNAKSVEYALKMDNELIWERHMHVKIAGSSSRDTGNRKEGSSRKTNKS